MSGNKQQRNAIAKQMVICCMTTIVSKTAAAPIDRVKILLQCQNEIVKAGRLSGPYKGIIDCVARTFRNEGRLVDDYLFLL